LLIILGHFLIFWGVNRQNCTMAPSGIYCWDESQRWDLVGMDLLLGLTPTAKPSLPPTNHPPGLRLYMLTGVPKGRTLWPFIL
jgi:hypothetical protein